MSAYCQLCGKGKMIGRRVTFSGKRNRRTFRPNLHVAWTTEAGRRVRGTYCTKCIRRVKAKRVLVASA